MSNILTFRQARKPTGDSAWGKFVTIRSVMRTAALLAAISATGVPGSSQSNPELEKFFRLYGKCFRLGDKPDNITPTNLK